MFQSVRYKLMAVYLLLILFAMQLIGAYFIQSLNQYFVNNYTKTIAHEALFLANLVSLPMSVSNGKEPNLLNVLQPFSALANASVYVLDKDGNVIGTSANPFIIGQKRVDPEVTEALLGLQTQQIALDPRTRQRYLYLAVPVRYRNRVRGAVEIVAPMSGVYQSISRIIIIFATGTLIALGLTALLAAIIARTITGPITAITRTARALAGGDFDQVVDIYSNDEIGELASTFNMLTRRLKQAMRSTEQEKRRLQAVMSTMSDGVIATSRMNDILLINPAASQLLRAAHPVIGYRLSDVLPGTFAAGDHQLVEVGEKTISVSVMALDHDRAESGGAALDRRAVDSQGGQVLVMRDVTEETRLEAARKRFVADVSHELRTPLTTIKSYVEALLEGAYRDEDLARHFLQVMDRETNRMIRLIRDLLQLTRFDAGYEQLRRESVSIQEVINGLAERFALLVFEAEVQFVVDAPDQALVSIDRDRFDQVLDNIVSNSLKYTPKHGIITVSASVDRNAQQVNFLLQDNGSGIAARELPNIFDRFYRVDKARSRQLGGTGLGLSIAREIVMAHGGEIVVESGPEEGTTVRISLPVEGGEESL